MNSETRFFILDCEGLIVGNVKGYRTHRGAKSALMWKNRKLHTELEQKAHNLYWGTGVKAPRPGIIWRIKALPIVNIETVKG